ncbi:hypothetical protein [Streptomyces sp. NPDC001020]
MYDLIRRTAHGLRLLFGPGTGTHRAGAPRLHRHHPAYLNRRVIGAEKAVA